MAINIEKLTSDEILADSTFEELLSMKDVVEKTKIEMLLAKKSAELGVDKQYSKLLTAHKKKKNTKNSNDNHENTISDGYELLNGEPNLKKWHTFSESGPTGVIDAFLANYITKHYYIFVASKMPYIYDGGVYRLDETETKLKSIIENLIYDRVVTINIIDRVYRLIIANNSLQRSWEDWNNHPKYWINFKNGFFDPIEWKMLPHNPKYLSINQIPHEFDPEASHSGRSTQNFLDYAMPNKGDQEMFWQYYGYCMTTDTRFQKFLIFKGQGGTGKSQLIHIADAIIGGENLSNISMEQLNERFFPTMLLGKLLNTNADIRSNALETTDGIKRATGEDYLFAERKGKDGFSFKSYAKLLFSANEIPITTEEKSEAIYRRMMIIKVDRKPTEDMKNINLEKELTNEINYSIMMSCRALQRLYQNGAFSETESSVSNIEELRMEADNIFAFLTERTKKIPGKSAKTSEMYEEYVKYCDDFGRKKVSLHSFHKNLKNKGYTKKRGSGGGYEVYEDVVLLDANSLDADENGFVKVDAYQQAEVPWKVQ